MFNTAMSKAVMKPEFWVTNLHQSGTLAQNQTELLGIFVTALEPIPSRLIHRGSVTYHNLIANSHWSQDSTLALSDTKFCDLPHYTLLLSYYPVLLPNYLFEVKKNIILKKDRAHFCKRS